jgi:hypothetical protein
MHAWRSLIGIRWQHFMQSGQLLRKLQQIIDLCMETVDGQLLTKFQADSSICLFLWIYTDVFKTLNKATGAIVDY